MPKYSEPYAPDFNFSGGSLSGGGGIGGGDGSGEIIVGAGNDSGDYPGTGSGVPGATLATNYDGLIGQEVGSGQCVALVQTTSNVGLTSTWSPGDLVQGNTNLAPGTVIATFGSDGNYANTPGQSHAAIYLGQNSNGIVVEDQWLNQAVHVRTIPWTTDNSYESGSKFYVVSH
ncbi:BPSL0067 family protein [Methylocapsa palsarum]|uniref:BPSL0067 family protein n=1 Tax=Methylocapsa palsarum TaxID=1612308 RepID=UPI000B85DB2F|nr:BPSL0067 family protein [Methylocapsa palsarum]